MTTVRRRVATIAGLALAASLLIDGRGAGGSLQPGPVRDPEFAAASGGVVVLDPVVGDLFTGLTKALPLGDGSLLLGLTTDFPFFGNWVVKLRPDGSLDTTFGSAGRTPGMVSTPVDGVGDIEVDSRGRIVVGAGSRLQWLLPDGTPDPSIEPCDAPCGVVSQFEGVSFVDSDIADIIVLADDSLVVASRSSVFAAPGTDPVLLTKMRPDGPPDASFGADATPGSVTVDAFGRAEVVVRPSAEIVAVATTEGELHAFTPDGRPSTTFGGGTGWRPLGFGSPGDLVSITEQAAPDEWLMSIVGSPLIRMGNGDGDPVPGFGVDGTLDAGALGPVVGDAAVLRDGRLLVLVAGPEHAGVAQLLPNGMLDGSFGVAASPGWLPLDLPSGSTPGALVLDGDRLTVLSSARGGSVIEVRRFLLGRLTAAVPITPYAITDGFPGWATVGPATVGTRATRIGNQATVP